jgi:signal transduction histidine kinase
VDLAPRAVLLSLTVAIVLFAAILSIRSASYFQRPSFMQVFAPASMVILIGMTALNIYASFFYRDVFYQFLALGWLANAIYIGFEAFFPMPETGLAQPLRIYVFSIISILPFACSSLVSIGGEVRWRSLARSILYWMIAVFGSYVFLDRIIDKWWPDSPPELRFACNVAAGIAFTMWALAKTGKALAPRLDPDTQGEWARIFPLTFYLYAGFQPFHLLRVFPSLQTVTKGLFAAALAVKALNSLCAISIVFRDFAEMKRRLRERNWLADLGALTASIEHDVKNPLFVIDNKLSELKKRYQSDTEMQSKLHEIEVQNLRIYATTQIIPVLRGEEKYYKQFMSKVSVRDVILTSVRAVKEELNTRDMNFITEDNVIFVKAYRPMLQQAVVNILKNAVEAIREAHRERGSVYIAWSKENGQMAATFLDNGAGIGRENLAKVTTLFTTKSEKKPNSGIGLFITERILEFHRGSLRIESGGEGQGTKVTILLPIWSDIE